MRRLVLASQSPARLATLRSAGIDPLVRVSGFDEDEFLSTVKGGPAQQVLGLATGKAMTVARSVDQRDADFVIGCDSMFEFEGTVYGKPHSAEAARERLRAQRGRTGVLHTGHLLVELATGHALGAVSHATVHFADMSDAEIEVYIATGEQLEVAGSFTTDGLGGSFIDDIEGDYHGVVGISLPLVRQLLAKFGVSITEFWSAPGAGRAADGVDPDAVPAGSGDGMDFHHRADRVGGARISPALHRNHGADAFYLDSRGHRHWGLNGAAGIAAYRERDGHRELLMQHRASWSHGGDTWAVPGGAREWFESPLEGATREFEEETQISGASLAVRGSLRAEQGDWTYTTYIAEATGDTEPVADPESAELVWLPLDEVTSVPLLPAFAEAWPEIRAIIEGQ